MVVDDQRQMSLIHSYFLFSTPKQLGEHIRNTAQYRYSNGSEKINQIDPIKQTCLGNGLFLMRTARKERGIPCATPTKLKYFDSFVMMSISKKCCLNTSTFKSLLKDWLWKEIPSYQTKVYLLYQTQVGSPAVRLRLARCTAWVKRWSEAMDFLQTIFKTNISGGWYI